MRGKILNAFFLIVSIVVMLPTIIGIMLNVGYFQQSLENEVRWTIEAGRGHEGILHTYPSAYKVQEQGIDVEHTVNIGSHLDIWFNNEWIPGHVEFSSLYHGNVFIADNGGTPIILTDGMRVRYQG